MNNPLKLALAGVILLCTASCGTVKNDALDRLELVAKKYREMGSYEAFAAASRSLEPGLEARVQLRLGYASSKFTPPDSPVPMLQAIRMSGFDTVGADGKPVKNKRSFAGPGPHFSFDQVAWRVTSAKIVGTEELVAGRNPKKCDVIEATYEPTNQNIKEPVRYWIEPSSNTIWKFQFSERDPLSKSGDIFRWTITFDKWIENEPPPEWLVQSGSKFAGQESSALVGHAAPEISGLTTAGQPFQLSKLRGRVVVLDFWATWCGPCNEEMASLERLRNAFSPQDVEIWSITEDKPELAKRWLAERKRTLPGIFVERDSVFKKYSVESLPVVAVIDPEGNVAKQWIGLRTETDIKKVVEKILAGSR
jgi:peroxiredoxin